MLLSLAAQCYNQQGNSHDILAINQKKKKKKKKWISNVEKSQRMQEILEK